MEHVDNARLAEKSESAASRCCDTNVLHCLDGHAAGLLRRSRLQYSVAATLMSIEAAPPKR